MDFQSFNIFFLLCFFSVTSYRISGLWSVDSSTGVSYSQPARGELIIRIKHIRLDVIFKAGLHTTSGFAFFFDLCRLILDN